MLQEQFEIIGFFGDIIYFKIEEKLVTISNKLPKADLILRLKIEPEDIKSIRDEILVQASKKPLTYEDKEKLIKGKV
jgi:hypothetical protein